MKLYSILVVLGIISFSLSNAQTVKPEVNGDIYSLTFNNLKFKVDASAGAKVSSYKIDGDEFLVTEEDLPGFLWGAVLWPAPQSEFGWPPPKELDDGQYTGAIEGNVIKLTSPIDVDKNDNEMQFIKSIWSDNNDASISFDYELINKSSSTITKALWELTRVPVNGLTFWPTGPGGAWGDLASSVVDEAGHSWLDIDAETRRGVKFFADGKDGWFAHVDKDRHLYIKSFDDVDRADFADGEAELELWIADAYVELENLSAAVTLNSEETMNYEVKWHLRHLPNNISIEVGNTELTDYVKGVLDGTIPPAPPASIESISALNHSLYPNPASDKVYLEMREGESNAVVKIYDVAGALQLTAEVSNGNPIDISNFSEGMYLYSIELNSGVENGRFLKH